MKKTSHLKQLIQSKQLEFLMEAHNGMSSIIAQEAGFKGIWGSGLSISASLGVRDNNEASWTQVIDVLEFMSDATDIPILLDGDTGYGNFNNVRRLIKKLEQRDIAGVCIEDKLFPKTNSFINGESQDLADIDEFCGKIKAAKDTQKDPDFCVVARVEAFIAGLGLEEALKRAEAYENAGADALLIHSKKSTAEDIVDFMKHWKKNTPIIIVPTKYYSTPTELFNKIGISTIIWANHSIRSSVQAIKETVNTIHKEQHLKNIESNIVSVSEIFRLQGSDELAQAEKQYLPGYELSLSSIILAAGASKIDSLTENIPKCLIDINNKTILDHQIDAFKKFNISDITIVRGDKKEAFLENQYTNIDNNSFHETHEVYSLYLAKEKLKNECFISYGDIVFKDYFIHECLNNKSDISIIVDSSCKKDASNKDYISATKEYDPINFNQDTYLTKMNRKIDANSIHGEFIGLIKTSKKGSNILLEALSSLPEEELKTMHMQDLLNHLIEKGHQISIIYIQGNWADVNTIADLHLATNLYA
ncbi:phosphoenolpyruvate mutase [Candidatus Marinamargulisbacteria bacterium SCGC AG-343-D04]|nr:phosphoenolpyruvate mutase [Candidatus Marinamargulisbacteria bacterium SCGC AG-343-D04]